MGTPFLRQDYRTRSFKGAVAKARKVDPTIPADTTPHDLRHHYASVLLAAGESVVAVAELLGHENAVLVMKIYGHLLPGCEDHARRAIDAAFGPKISEAQDSLAAPRRPQ